MLQITESIALGDDEITWAFSRSGGPGGQNVNKVASKAQLSWYLDGTAAIAEPVKTRLKKAHPSCLTQEGYLLITSQESRDQGRNKEICLEKLAEYLQTASIPPKKRFATKPTKSSKRRRAADKRQNADRKENRKLGSWD